VPESDITHKYSFFISLFEVKGFFGCILWPDSKWHIVRKEYETK